MADDTEHTENPAPPPAESEAPQWAQDLQRTLQELPGKLRASVTDDDKSGIAEAVHGLFERSGAFEKPSESSTETSEGEEAETSGEREVERTESEPPPTKAGKLSRFASWFAGE